MHPLHSIREITPFAASLAIIAFVLAPANAVTLGISQDNRYFTINGKPTYLHGISYYGALSINKPEWLKQDLDDMREDGFNWIRVWVTWDPPGHDVSAIDKEGKVREPYMARLKEVIRQCDKRGIVVDCTMTRTYMGTLENNLIFARTLAKELLPFRNVYFDVANERDVPGARFVSFDEMGQLIAAIKEIDPTRLCTASGGQRDKNILNEYLTTGKCDFIAPHLCRNEDCPSKTIGTVRQLIVWMEELHHRVPIHLQEPFRRSYGRYDPTEENYFRDNTGGKIGGAAGWCLHNGDTRSRADRLPQRSFLMDDESGRMYAQLDQVEKAVADGGLGQLGYLSPYVLRFQAEYPEQVAHETGTRDGYAWVAKAGKDTKGLLAVAAYDGALTARKCRAVWTISATGGSGKDTVVDLEVVAGARTVARKTVQRKNLAQDGVWKAVSLNFDLEPGKPFEMRANWPGVCSVKVDHITLNMDRDSR